MNTAFQLASAIEHTLLRPEATGEQIDKLCDDAVRYAFAGVCVHPVYVRRCVRRLESLRSTSSSAGSRPVVVSVAGFPLGANCSETKADEARRAMDDGATEVDMVIHLGALCSGDAKSVRHDVESVVRVVHRARGDGIVKVILETTVLTAEQIVMGCRCCAEAEADFVKTSSGFHPSGGATVEHVRLLHRHAAPMRVKAAGGIRTAADASSMLDAGASRIGTSNGVAIVAEASGC